MLRPEVLPYRRVAPVATSWRRFFMLLNGSRDGRPIDCTRLCARKRGGAWGGGFAIEGLFGLALPRSHSWAAETTGTTTSAGADYDSSSLISG